MAELKDYPEKLREVVALFEDIDEAGRAEILLDYSDRFIEVPAEVAAPPFPEENYVARCESGAYVFVQPAGDHKINFYFSVENPQGVSARALGAILQETLSGEAAETINKIPDDVVIRLFGRRIAMGKGEGLLGMVSLLKYFANKHHTA